MISNCGGDEYGRASGGMAGDQTGNEWKIINWYSSPWKCVLRHPREDVRELLAELGTWAAENDCIGYDQHERDTYWQALQAANFDPRRIEKHCETDCSAGVIANTKAVGNLLNIPHLKNIRATYTGNMRACYRAAEFEVLEDPKYLTSPKYLKRGDILLNDVTHTATNLTDGELCEEITVSAEPKESPTCTVILPELQKGDVSMAVRSAQELLKMRGFSLGVDGDFGSETDSKVRQFQRGVKIDDDGVIGSETWGKLIR